ncbi:MAG TPA: hypothetical protein VGS22_04740 [Thermoanaerobaculia bacterium]|jgi:hypothetical protein|nr:hypothetical protein [Thermoanaerobaculia bacterium]
MADTLIIVSESGKVYQVTLGTGQSTELKADDQNAEAAKSKAAHGVVIADIDPNVEQRAAGPGEKPFTIMCTFVNLPSIGDN